MCACACRRRAVMCAENNASMRDHAPWPADTLMQRCEPRETERSSLLALFSYFQDSADFTGESISTSSVLDFPGDRLGYPVWRFFGGTGLRVVGYEKWGLSNWEVFFEGQRGFWVVSDRCVGQRSDSCPTAADRGPTEVRQSDSPTVPTVPTELRQSDIGRA